MYMLYVGNVWRWCHSQDDDAAAAAAISLHPPPLTSKLSLDPNASSLAFSFSSDSAANQTSTHALRNKLLISAFVVVAAAAAAADPNALFILRSCSKSKETTKKEGKN
jgi:hypothetical protein